MAILKRWKEKNNWNLHKQIGKDYNRRQDKLRIQNYNNCQEDVIKFVNLETWTFHKRERFVSHASMNFKNNRMLFEGIKVDQ